MPKPLKKQRVRCRWCKTSRPPIKFYIIADDMEKPKPYHTACIRKLELEVMIKLFDGKGKYHS